MLVFWRYGEQVLFGWAGEAPVLVDGRSIARIVPGSDTGTTLQLPAFLSLLVLWPEYFPVPRSFRGPASSISEGETAKRIRASWFNTSASYMRLPLMRAGAISMPTLS